MKAVVNSDFSNASIELSLHVNHSLTSHGKVLNNQRLDYHDSSVIVRMRIEKAFIVESLRA